MSKFFNTLIIGAASGAAAAYFFTTEKGKAVKTRIDEEIASFKEDPKAYQNQVVEKASDYKDLAAKLDWWIEHPEERLKYKSEYVKHSKNFQIEKSIDLIIDMFNQAVADWDAKYDGRKKRLALQPTIVSNTEN